MTKGSWTWPIVIIGTSILVSIFTYIFPTSVLRPLLILGFLLLCPGMAWIRLIQLGDAVIELSLALGLSISIDTIVTFVFLYSNRWSPDGIFITLLIISCTGASLQLASKSSVFPFFYRHINVKQSPVTALASHASLTQQETKLHLAEIQTQYTPAVRLSPISQRQDDLHLAEMQTQYTPAVRLSPISQRQDDLPLAEMQTQGMPTLPPSPTASSGKDQPIEKLETVRVPALPTPPQETNLPLAEMQTQSMPMLLPSPTTEQKESTHLDEIHTRMLPVQTPPPSNKKLRKGFVSLVPSTPVLPRVPPTPTLPSVPPTPVLPFDEPAPKELIRSEVPVRTEDKNIPEPLNAPALMPRHEEVLADEQAPIALPAATPKHRASQAQAPRTPHPLLAEQDENRQSLDAFDDDDENTTKNPRVVKPSKGEK